MVVVLVLMVVVLVALVLVLEPVVVFPQYPPSKLAQLPGDGPRSSAINTFKESRDRLMETFDLFCLGLGG